MLPVFSIIDLSLSYHLKSIIANQMYFKGFFKLLIEKYYFE